MKNCILFLLVTLLVACGTQPVETVKYVTASGKVIELQGNESVVTFRVSGFVADGLVLGYQINSSSGEAVKWGEIQLDQDQVIKLQPGRYMIAISGSIAGDQNQYCSTFAEFEIFPAQLTSLQLKIYCNKSPSGGVQIGTEIVQVANFSFWLNSDYSPSAISANTDLRVEVLRVNVASDATTPTVVSKLHINMALSQGSVTDCVVTDMSGQQVMSTEVTAGTITQDFYGDDYLDYSSLMFGSVSIPANGYVTLKFVCSLNGEVGGGLAASLYGVKIETPTFSIYGMPVRGPYSWFE